jgi:phosphate-selective porin OprO/OprP
MVCVIAGLACLAPAALAQGGGAADPAGSPAVAAGHAEAVADDGQAEATAAQAQADAATKRSLAERILREREVLGTRFRGHLFVDGLPISPDGAQIGKSLELRRLRLSFARSLAFRWEVVGTAELASGRAELRDLYVRRYFDRLGTITVGNQSEPMGLEELTSQLVRPLLEPSMPIALVPGRNFGIAMSNRYGDFHYQAGVFGAGTEQEGRRELGTAFTGRLTHRSIDAHGDVRHFGISLSHRELEDTENFRSVPEVGIGQEFLVNTGTIENASRTRRLGIEYLESFGRWSVRSEITGVRVTRDAARQLQFGGVYVEAGWVVWGDGARYNDGTAVPSRAPVNSDAAWGNAWGRGNLTLSARLSRIDLSDADIVGGTQTNLTLGAAWDLSQRTRIAANLVHFVDLTGPNAQAEQSTALAIRYQYAW